MKVVILDLARERSDAASVRNPGLGLGDARADAEQCQRPITDVRHAAYSRCDVFCIVFGFADSETWIPDTLRSLRSLARSGMTTLIGGLG